MNVHYAPGREPADKLCRDRETILQRMNTLPGDEREGFAEDVDYVTCLDCLNILKERKS